MQKVVFTGVIKIRIEPDTLLCKALTPVFGFIELEKYLTDEMPGMPVYSYELQYLVKPEVKGVIANPIGHFFFEYATVGE